MEQGKALIVRHDVFTGLPPRPVAWFGICQPGQIVPHFLVPIYCLTHLPAAEGEASDHRAALQTRKQWGLGQR